MTQAERTQFQKDVLYAFHMTQIEVSNQRGMLGLMGKRLERLGLALQRHPELVTPLPEPNALYEYLDELNQLPDRQKVIDLCAELRTLEQQRKDAEMRKQALYL